MLSNTISFRMIEHSYTKRNKDLEKRGKLLSLEQEGLFGQFMAE
jgi:hypothetical protein